MEPLRSLLASLVLPLALATTLSLANDELDTRHWDPPSEEELAATSPRIDPNAAAEFLLRQVRIDDDGEDTSFTYHNRAKIFTEAGVLQWDTVDLIYQTGWRIYGIRGRVIYPDGSVTELDRGDIYKRQIYKDEKSQETGPSKGSFWESRTCPSAKRAVPTVGWRKTSTPWRKRIEDLPPTFSSDASPPLRRLQGHDGPRPLHAAVHRHQLLPRAGRCREK